MSGPWTFDQAVAAQRDATQKQEQAERFVKTAYRDFAEAERVYREALATKITELRAEGMSVTLCGDLARGDSKVAQLKYRRDISEGVREAAGQAVWRATADRKTVEGLMQWSMRRNLAEGYGGQVEPVYETAIGGRR